MDPDDHDSMAAAGGRSDSDDLLSDGEALAGRDTPSSGRRGSGSDLEAQESFITSARGGGAVAWSSWRRAGRRAGGAGIALPMRLGPPSSLTSICRRLPPPRRRPHAPPARADAHRGGGEPVGAAALPRLLHQHLQAHARVSEGRCVVLCCCAMGGAPTTKGWDGMRTAGACSRRLHAGVSLPQPAAAPGAWLHAALHAHAWPGPRRPPCPHPRSKRLGETDDAIMLM